MELIEWMVAAVVEAGLGLVLGATLFAALFRGAWGWLFGTRTELVRWWVAALLVARAWWTFSEAGLFLHGALGPLSWLSVALGMWIGLAVPEAEVEPVAPVGLTQDLDGLEVPLRDRPAWAGLLLFLGSTFNVVLAALLAWFWSRQPPPGARLRVTSTHVSVSRGQERWSLPLAGLQVHLGTRWDGAPLLVLRSTEGEVRLPVGGQPPGELAWLVDTLQAMAPLAALPEAVPEAPPELRELLRVGRDDRAGGSSSGQAEGP